MEQDRLEQGRLWQDRVKQKSPESKGLETKDPESKEPESERERQSLEDRGFIVRRLLGQGAFSRVYSVEERGTGRRAACKVSENIRLLVQEEEILKRLQHPLFPEYYAGWVEGRKGFLLMEEIAGENLAGLIKRGMQWSVYEIAEMGMELAEGLLYLHEGRPGILFRDVKPENIILREDGRVKLLDFGCSCELDTDGGTRAGTPGFAAPEQLEGEGKQSCLCDVYGLGRTLQDLLWAGDRHEKAGRTWKEFGERRDRRRLEKLLAACVEKEPSVRPADMRVVAAVLFHICAPALGGGRQEDRGGFWQKGIICEKNILKSTWKTS